MKPIKSQYLGDRIFYVVTFSSAFVVIFVLAGILVALLNESWESILKFGFFEFIFSNDWNPVIESFGGAVSLTGTILTTLIAMTFAIPISLGIAIYITEICPLKLRYTISVSIELLAAIPSIIYGMWGLFTLAPLMGDYIEPFLQNTVGQIPLIGVLFEGTPLGIDIFTAGIVLSIMIIPFITSIARDTINLTPQVLKESAFSIGTTNWEVIKDVILPYSKFGIYGGIIISLGRVLGETMAVAFVLGNRQEFAKSLFDATSTITVTLANEFTEADSDVYMSSLFLLALLLFIFSFITLATAKFIVHMGAKKWTI